MSDDRSTRIRLAARSDQCAGSGGCCAVAPQLFGLNEDGWVEVLDEHPPIEHLDAALEAEDTCPVGAIDVFDEEGNSLA